MVISILCFSWIAIFLLNKLKSTKLIALPETTTLLMNYKCYSLHTLQANVHANTFNNVHVCKYLITYALFSNL